MPSCYGRELVISVKYTRAKNKTAYHALLDITEGGIDHLLNQLCRLPSICLKMGAREPFREVLHYRKRSEKTGIQRQDRKPTEGYDIDKPCTRIEGCCTPRDGFLSQENVLIIGVCNFIPIRNGHCDGRCKTAQSHP